MFLDLKFLILKEYGSQADFALKVQSHESKVSAVLHGRRKLKAEEAERWSEALGCSVSDLATVTR